MGLNTKSAEVIVSFEVRRSWSCPLRIPALQAWPCQIFSERAIFTPMSAASCTASSGDLPALSESGKKTPILTSAAQAEPTGSAAATTTANSASVAAQGSLTNYVASGRSG